MNHSRQPAVPADTLSDETRASIIITKTLDAEWGFCMSPLPKNRTAVWKCVGGNQRKVFATLQMYRGLVQPSPPSQPTQHQPNPNQPNQTPPHTVAMLQTGLLLPLTRFQTTVCSPLHRVVIVTTSTLTDIHVYIYKYIIYMLHHATHNVAWVLGGMCFCSECLEAAPGKNRVMFCFNDTILYIYM